jgi:hypothetical protein
MRRVVDRECGEPPRRSYSLTRHGFENASRVERAQRSVGVFFENATQEWNRGLSAETLRSLVIWSIVNSDGGLSDC